MALNISHGRSSQHRPVSYSSHSHQSELSVCELLWLLASVSE